MIYTIEGNRLFTPYDIGGDSINSAFDIGGNRVFPSATGDPLTVMTYNVGKFSGINSQQAMQNLIISTYDADVIGMQEIGNSSTIPTVGQNMLTDYQYKQISNHKNYILTATKELAISNVVIADFQNQDPEDMSRYNETRAYTKVEVEVNGKTIAFINTHLCYLTTSIKYLQMGELFDIAEQYDYVIITGDFNSYEMTEQAADYINMYKPFVDAGYHLANNSPRAGFQNTYTSATSASSLSDLSTAPDSIIVSSNIDIESVVFDTTKFSYLNGSAIDHIPVIAHLTIY